MNTKMWLGWSLKNYIHMDDVSIYSYTNQMSNEVSDKKSSIFCISKYERKVTKVKHSLHIILEYCVDQFLLSKHQTRPGGTVGPTECSFVYLLVQCTR